MNRCAHQVFDITTKRTRRCKLTKKSNNLCHVHLKMVLPNISATKIQAVWLGYRCRTKLSNLFVNLPSELQRKVVGHMRTNFVTQKLHQTYSKIYYNKFIALRDNLLERQAEMNKFSRLNESLYLERIEYMCVEARFRYIKNRCNDLLYNPIYND